MSNNSKTGKIPSQPHRVRPGLKLADSLTPAMRKPGPLHCIGIAYAVVRYANLRPRSHPYLRAKYGVTTMLVIYRARIRPSISTNWRSWSRRTWASAGYADRSDHFVSCLRSHHHRCLWGRLLAGPPRCHRGSNDRFACEMACNNTNGAWMIRLHSAAFARTRFAQYDSSDVAAGDAQRVWFPEMIERLRVRWHRGMPCDALIVLRDELNAQLQRIRSERGIHPPIFKCPCCGHVGECADLPLCTIAR